MTGCTWYPNYKPEYPPVHPFAHFQFLDFPNKKPCKLEVLWALLLVASFAKEPYPVYNSVHPPVQPFALVIIIFWSTQVCAVILNASKKPNKIRGFLCSFVKEPCKIGALFSLFFGVHSILCSYSGGMQTNPVKSGICCALLPKSPSHLGLFLHFDLFSPLNFVQSSQVYHLQRKRAHARVRVCVRERERLCV